MTETRIDAVVFDLGGVLLDWNPRHLYRKLFDDHEALERFLTTVCTLEWHAQHDAGTSMDETIPILVEEHPHLADEIVAWRARYLDMVSGYVEGMEDLVDDVRAAGIPTYALSNMPAEVVDELVAAFPAMAGFRGMIVSGEELVTKPDPEIYRRLASRFHLDPARTVFVDDVAANVDAAWTMGFRAVRFESAPALRQALVRWGVALRTAPE